MHFPFGRLPRCGWSHQKTFLPIAHSDSRMNGQLIASLSCDGSGGPNGSLSSGCVLEASKKLQSRLSRDRSLDLEPVPYRDATPMTRYLAAHNRALRTAFYRMYVLALPYFTDTNTQQYDAVRSTGFRIACRASNTLSNLNWALDKSMVKQATRLPCPQT